MLEQILWSIAKALVAALPTSAIAASLVYWLRRPAIEVIGKGSQELINARTYRFLLSYSEETDLRAMEIAAEASCVGAAGEFIEQPRARLLCGPLNSEIGISWQQVDKQLIKLTAKEIPAVSVWTMEVFTNGKEEDVRFEVAVRQGKGRPARYSCTGNTDTIGEHNVHLGLIAVGVWIAAVLAYWIPVALFPALRSATVGPSFLSLGWRDVAILGGMSFLALLAYVVAMITARRERRFAVQTYLGWEEPREAQGQKSEAQPLLPIAKDATTTTSAANG